MRLRIILVGLFFALAFAGLGAKAFLTFSSHKFASTSGWDNTRERGRVLVAAVSPYGPVNALQQGDEIVEFNGQPVKDQTPFTFFDSAEAGSSYTIVIRRDGSRRELTLQTVPRPLIGRIQYVAHHLMIPTILLFIGLAVFLLKPYDKRALLLALLLGMIIGSNLSSFEVMPGWVKAVVIANTIIDSFWFVIFFHLMLVFPEPSRMLRRFPRLEGFLYVPALLAILPYATYLFYRLATTHGRAPDFWGVHPLVSQAILVISAIYIVGGLLLLADNYRQVDQLSRRKLRVVLAGTVPFFFLLIALLLSFLILGRDKVVGAISEWPVMFGVILNFTYVLMPLSFAYAIVRHQVIPVSLIIRRGLQYLLARNALRVAVALPIVGLIFSIFANPHRTLYEILLRNSFYFYLLVLAALAFGLVFRKRLSEWIDRKFFREAYNQDKILRELIEDVKRTDSMTEMSQLVSQKVDAALHPERMYFFYREEERRDLGLGYSSGGPERELRIPEEFELLRFVEYQGSAQDFPFPEKINLPQNEKDWLSSLGTKLIVPMTGTDNRLAGLFLLGQKKSEVSYMASDRQLLETLADQIALVYENVRLKERVDRDRRIKHEVLARVEERNINLLKECPRCSACFDSAAQSCPRDGSELTLPLAVERTIEGRYRLDERIGKGGMGVVYEATDLRLNRKVAVKILGGLLFGNLEALRRFEREAQTSARLSHPHIITVHDYGVLSTEGAYLVMELVEGETLGGILKREGHFAPGIAAEWLDQVLSAVGAAHKAGVIHRDLKPDNIFIARGENGQQDVKVLDFGLAKLAHRDANVKSATASMTTPGTVMGTFGYMSPEQLTGRMVDERSDLFSIGVIAVEALTGRRPFSGKTYHELLTAILSKPFHLGGDAPEVMALDKVLQKCLAKESENRFASATEMQRELIAAIHHCPILARDASVNREADTAIFKK